MKNSLTKINWILVVFACLLALSAVWVGVEKARLAYDLERYKNLVQEKTEFITKLETEKALLLSPDRLKKYAKKYNLSPATAGQLRTLPMPHVTNNDITIKIE